MNRKFSVKFSFTTFVFGLGLALIALGNFSCATATPPAMSPSTVNSDSVFSVGGVGLDYDPTVRCSDQGTVAGSVACSPQLGFAACGDPSSQENLSNCPDRCQNCYDQDLQKTQSDLGVHHLTIYQPNYYILEAAKKLGMKVILGTCDDFIIALGQPTSQGTCTTCGFPSMCGSDLAEAFINGGCRGTTPWAPTDFCESKCKSGEPCTNGDCSCTSDADCGGSVGSCDTRGYFPAFSEYLGDGTVAGIQLGNEVLSSSVNGSPLTKSEVVTAAGVLRTALHDPKNNYTQVPIIVSLVLGNEKNFCENGAPPANVDLIASHPYCNNVASVPPAWPFESGMSPDQAAKACANQVIDLYQNNSVVQCGAANVFIGETGYNTGCPGGSDESTHLQVLADFIPEMLSQACSGGIPLFLFAQADVCPETGCLPGCPNEPNLGNGYFGIYHTKDYGTKGDLVLKLPQTPQLTCP